MNATTIIMIQVKLQYDYLLLFICFRLANKQDKMNALLGSELIEILSLEKLVNQSRSPCHIVSVVLRG